MALLRICVGSDALKDDFSLHFLFGCFQLAGEHLCISGLFPRRWQAWLNWNLMFPCERNSTQQRAASKKRFSPFNKLFCSNIILSKTKKNREAEEKLFEHFFRCAGTGNCWNVLPSFATKPFLGLSQLFLRALNKSHLFSWRFLSSLTITREANFWLGMKMISQSYLVENVYRFVEIESGKFD